MRPDIAYHIDHDIAIDMGISIDELDTIALYLVELWRNQWYELYKESYGV
tara:strand:- start:311 stop:460 length:150 start_codon:yes stop_codon:yes gene_type:complete